MKKTEKTINYCLVKKSKTAIVNNAINHSNIIYTCLDELENAVCDEFPYVKFIDLGDYYCTNAELIMKKHIKAAYLEIIETAMIDIHEDT